MSDFLSAIVLTALLIMWWDPEAAGRFYGEWEAQFEAGRLSAFALRVGD